MWHNECTDSYLHLEMHILLPIVIVKPALASCDLNFLACKSWCASLVNYKDSPSSGITCSHKRSGDVIPNQPKPWKHQGQNQTGNEISKGYPPPPISKTRGGGYTQETSWPKSHTHIFLERPMESTQIGSWQVRNLLPKKSIQLNMFQTHIKTLNVRHQVQVCWVFLTTNLQQWNSLNQVTSLKVGACGAKCCFQLPCNICVTFLGCKHQSLAIVTSAQVHICLHLLRWQIMAPTNEGNILTSPKGRDFNREFLFALLLLFWLLVVCDCVVLNGKGITSNYFV